MYYLLNNCDHEEVTKGLKILKENLENSANHLAVIFNNLGVV